MSCSRAFLSPYVTWLQLLRNSWQSAAASVTSQTLVAVASALAGRELGASAYGSVVAIVAYCGWFSMLGSYPCCSLMPSLLAGDSETETGKRRAMATAIATKSVLSLVAAVLAYLLMPVLMPSVWHGPLRGAAILYLIPFAVAPIRATVDLVLQAAGWLGSWSLSNTVAAAVPVVLLAAYAFSPTRLAPHGYVVIVFVSIVASTGFSIVLLSRKVGGVRHLRPRADLATLFLSAGRGPWFSVLGNALCLYGVRTIIATSLPSRQLGLYEVVFAFIVWVTAIGTAVNIPALAAWSRLFAENDVDGMRRAVRGCQTATGVVLGTVGIISLVAARPILQAIYGPEYVGAATVLRIMALSLPLAGAGAWYWIAAYALGQPWRVAWPNIVSNVAMVTMAFVLVRYTSLGIAGAALAHLVSVVLWLVIYESEFRRALIEPTARTASPAVRS